MHDEIHVQVESKNSFAEDRHQENRSGANGSHQHASSGSVSSLQPGALASDYTPVAASMPPLDLTQEQIAAIARTVPGGADNVQDVYPLAPLQEGMLFHRLLNKQIDTYILSTLFALQSQEHANALIDALQKVIDRHDVLRTAVLWEEASRPVQVVYRRASLPIQQIALDSQRDPLEQLQERMRPERQTMDLRQAPLMQLQLAWNSDGTQGYAVLHVHHIVCDHQTLRNIVAEALSHMANPGDEATPASMPFRDYVAHALKSGAEQDAEAFFRRKLGDVDEPTAPFGVGDVHGDGSQLREAREVLDWAVAQQLRTQARRLGVSPGRLFHVAWALVAARTTARDDVVFGTVLLARHQRSAQAQRMLGMSVNTLPLRLRIQRATVQELVEQTQQELSELLNYEHVPLTLAQRCSGIGGTAPLFTSLLNYRRSLGEPSAHDVSVDGIKVLRRGEAWTNYPITMIIDDSGEVFGLTAQTDHRIDPMRIVAYVQTAVRSLVEALDRDPQMPALALTVLPDEERRQVVELFNATHAAYPREKLIHELFEEQVERTPHAVAVTCADQYLTYRQLNRRANQLARHLRDHGASEERFVGLCVERGIDMVVGVLGILKAGAAYVPLDANYPQQRLEYILADADPVAVVLHDKLRERLPANRQTIALDAQWSDIAAHSTANLSRTESGVSSNNLAYVIYTSGSTGQPKGVAIEHRNAVNLIWWGQSAMPMETFDCALHSTSLNFDLSVYECFVPLSAGGALHIVPNALSLLNESRAVTLINTVPSAVKSILDSGSIPPATRVVNLAGEPLRQELVERIFASSSVERVCNLYGPSETTTYSTWVSMLREDGFNSSIGRPIANTQIYILDAHRQPLPVGVVGEIYIGGAGVARGYFNRPEMTRQRFVADPFSSETGARLYATGDLGRWRSDGTIEYLGRNDHQVKIRGFRIELAEIESQLRHRRDVKEAVVVAREDASGDKRLTAYLVCETSTAPTVEELREGLNAVLPEYMVPSAFVILERLPLTPNGKLDRHALPEPTLSAYVNRGYEPPQGEIEEVLTGTWQALLGVERVGRHDNFFELGGHSLLIVQMLERLRRVGLAADVRSVFDCPTLADLARALAPAAAKKSEIPPNLIPPGCDALVPEMLPLVQLKPEDIEQIVRSVPGGAKNIQDIYPLAPLQEGILFHHLLASEGGDTYILQTVLSVESRAQVERLIAAVQTVVDRHEVLRTAVLWEDLPQPVQVVCRHAKVPVEESELDRSRDPQEQIKEWIRPERQRLDLRLAPLVRLNVAADEIRGGWFVRLQVHHITIDHVTLELLTADIVSELEGLEGPLISPIPYRNHVAQALSRARKHDAETFFRARLADVDETTAPFALSDTHGDGSQIEEAGEELEAALAEQVHKLARRSAVSAATLFHAAWALVVAHTSGRDDVVFGSVLLGRLQGDAGAERILGMFINTLPVRLQLQGLTSKQLVQQTQRELVELLGHEQASLAAAQRCSGLFGSAPLFTALLNYRHSVSTLESQWEQASGIKMLVGQERTNYPITVSVDDLGVGFTLTAKADRRIDPRRIVACLRTALRSLTEALDQAPQTPALALSILPAEERQQVVHRFNATDAAYAQESLIHELFEEQAQRWPQRSAVEYEERSLTFDQLNRKANQLARYLCEKGVGPDVLVGLSMERSLDMMCAMLGILKAGGAYVPLDPDYPAERLSYMLENAAPKVLLTQARLKHRFSAVTEVIAIDQEADEIARRPATNLDARAHGLRSHHLAYVIYTSGSTGQPKGVMVEHRNVMSLWQGLEHIYSRSGSCERVAVNASFNFDASVKQFVQLLSGRCVVVVPQELRWDASRLLKFLDERRIDGIDCTPWQLRSWLAEGLLDAGGRKPKVILVGGEAIDGELWSTLAQASETEFVNVYGPTESTVDTTFARVQRDAGVPHIGPPMENRRVYILGLHGQPVPVGVTGEMYIAGAGIARGYLKRPDLTEQKFLRDPFVENAEARMYRSGDLGRWRPDGAIEYAGRSDHQVKIRGFRIELGEIESRLTQHEQVTEAAVIVREDVQHDKRLVAYIVPGTDATPAVEVLRMHLKEVLPDYMVPSAFVILVRMPLTPSGKLDKQALPAPELEAYSNRDYEAPQGEIEQLLASIWQGLLNVERVGRHDNFFELGGHSLMIVQVMDRLRRAGLAAEVSRIFETPVLMDLAGALTSGTVQQHEAPANLIPPGCETITPEMLPLIDLTQASIERIVLNVPGGTANIQDIYPLAPLQEGIFFHHLLSESGADTYVVLTLLSVASEERLQEFIAALQAVIDRHDILRTAILSENLPRPVQVVYRKAVLPVDPLELEPGRNPAEQIRESARPEQLRIDPSRAPLIRLQVADGEDGRRFALLQLHHIVSDHVTLEIVIAEIVAHLERRAETLPQSAPYRNHVAQALAYSRRHDAEAFFSDKLADVDEPTAPFGLLDVHADGSHVDEASQAVDSELARSVRAQARRLGVTAATLFHAAWALVVAHTSGKDDVVFGTVLLGRLQGSAGAQRTLGMFINTLPLRIRLQGMNAKHLIEHTQRELIGLLSHEQASLAVAQRCSGVVGSTPLFTSLFNYRHSANSDALWCASGIEAIAIRERTNYPITFSVDDLADGFAFTVQTDSRIDARRLTQYMHRAVESLVEALEQTLPTPALVLPILPENEQQAVNEFNATLMPLPQEQLIHELFEVQVRRAPNGIALIHDKRRLTYSELNAKANQLARYLCERGVCRGRLVGICMERSPEMVLGVLAALKAGAGYVPLDPNYPAERLRYMLEDAAPTVVLTQDSLLTLLPQSIAPLIAIEAASSESAGYPAADLDSGDVKVTGEDVVYVIYTSGSTGRPKGTAMEHRSMINLITWHRHNLPLAEGQRVLQFAALSFDVAFQETFSTLCLGGTLVLLNESVRRDAGELIELLKTQFVERLFVPPLMLQSLAEYVRATREVPTTLKDVITAGEQLRLSPEIVDLFACIEDCRLHNHYGPTETHVVTALTLSGNPVDWPTLPTIGRPISNTRIHLLDERGQPVPIGVAGEIYIAGANVARGYLNRPDLSAQRFVADPFSRDLHARMYKTGDLGRWHADGSIDYLGRNDQQVKIRGYRIEPEEIEAQVALNANVAKAVVIVREDIPGEKRLVAYVVPRGLACPSAEELRNELKSALPAHMVPSAFVILDSLPQTPSGKLDRRALPPPQIGSDASVRYEPPQGETEQALAAVWQKLLGAERVGRDENFFELGGHSLLVLKALFEIGQALGCALKVTDIYRNPSVRELAQHIHDGADRDELIDLAREAVLDPSIVAVPGKMRCIPEEAILLTGCTGFVGRFLLAQLLQDTNATIYCLVRCQSRQQARQRLRVNLSKWDLWNDEFERRIVAVNGDLRLPRLGIDVATYEDMSRQLDSIYHCATSMNHLETYSMARRANVEGAKELVELAARHKTKLVNYISTLGIFGTSAAATPPVVTEDSPIETAQYRHSEGYMASKWVGEKIFMLARERGIPCNIFRLGLVWADGQAGRFDELQNVYRVMKTSLLTGCGIAGYRFPMAPTPVDYVARAIVYLANRYRDGQGTFHISSTRQPIQGLFERCNEILGSSLELVPYYNWICEIKRLHHSGLSLPAVPLIEFAFSMDEPVFNRHQQVRRSTANVRFDCTQTHQELESAGIFAPLLNERLLQLCLESMLSKDAELRESYAGDWDYIEFGHESRDVSDKQRRVRSNERPIARF